MKSTLPPKSVKNECDIVASEQGPSCKSINQLPDGKVIYVRFIPKTVKAATSSFGDSGFSGFSVGYNESKQRKRVHETDLHNSHTSDSKKLGTIISFSFSLFSLRFQKNLFAELFISSFVTFHLICNYYTLCHFSSTDYPVCS